MSLRPWMFLGQISAFELEGTRRLLDKLWESGIREVVLGDLIIDGKPAFSPNRDMYKDVKRQPPEMPSELAPKAKIIADAVKEAKERGFKIYLHDWGAYGGGSCINDPESLKYFLVRTQDAYEHYPQLDGFILDGPEWGYEIEPGHRSDLFRCFCTCCEQKAQQLGYDFDGMKAAADRLKNLLRSLSPKRMADFLQTQLGFLDSASLLWGEIGLLRWFRFKADGIQDFLGGIYPFVKKLNPEFQMACGPRTAAFAPLTGYDFSRLPAVVDFICPKLYLWMHGVDGLKGTVYRYAKTLMDWNSGVDEKLALDFVCKLFGFALPEVKEFSDLEQPSSEAFFSETVVGEIQKAMLQTNDTCPLRPWVGLHHAGVRLTAAELRLLLMAMERGGLESYIYWHYSDLRDEEWEVIKQV